MGASLQQEIEGELRVVEWASKMLTPAEIKLGITELEFLAMAWSIKYFDYYLRGRRFKVITDHSALKSMKTKHIFGTLKLERL
ncbi:MAG: RNase H-like domain-containing protein, partial [Clostridium sp.]|uniref:RNase H-like domain-containing protein n=1 Tax=Clostridium sp. TaxID=1506 RepID=UPI003F2E83CA